MVTDGYLEEAVLGKALSTLTGEQLKTMLSDLSMKASGAKSVLIQRLIEDADEHRVRQLFPNPVYALTEKGAELLRANQSVLADMWIDCEKAIEQGKNVAPEFKKPDTKKANRTNVFKLCFAMGLNLEETNDFFTKIYLDRTFNVKNVHELVYYFCIKNNKSYTEATDLIEKAEELLKTNSSKNKDSQVYKSSIREEPDFLTNAKE